MTRASSTATSRNAAMNVRLAVLETKIDAMEPRLAAIETLLTELKSVLDKQKGAWGTILLITSALWAVGIFVRDWLIARVH